MAIVELKVIPGVPCEGASLKNPLEKPVLATLHASLDGTTRLISCRFARTIPAYNLGTLIPLELQKATVCVVGIRDQKDIMERIKEEIESASRFQSTGSYRASREFILETVPLCIQTNPQ